MTPKPKKKNAAAVALGKLGAKRRNETLTPEQRSAAARHAINIRWKGRKVKRGRKAA